MVKIKNSLIDGVKVYFKTITEAVKDPTTGKNIKELLNEVTLRAENAEKNGSRGIFVDYNHVVSISEASEFLSYTTSEEWDCIWVLLTANAKNVLLKGATATRYLFFRKYGEFTTETFLEANRNGNIPADAEVVLINMKKADNSNYDNLFIDITYKYLPESVLDGYYKNIPTGKNYIDVNDLLYGYLIANGKLVENPNGIMSNKIYLEDGEDYTIQGCHAYGSVKRIYMAYFNSRDEFIGRIGIDPQSSTDSGNYGTASFQHHSNDGTIAYVRFVLQTAAAPIVRETLQLERGTTATAVVPFVGEKKFYIPDQNDVASKKKLKVLSIGNSYSEDMLSYVPWLMKSIDPEVDVTIGILYHSGASLEDHWLNKETAGFYTRYDKYVAGSMAWTIRNNISLAEGLDDENWDVILLQQGSKHSMNRWCQIGGVAVNLTGADYKEVYEATYKPFLNNYIEYLHEKLTYPVRIGWVSVMSRPVFSSSEQYNKDKVKEHAEMIIRDSQLVLYDSICDFVIPVTTAIENARLTSLADFGGTYKMLTADDGAHLEEGLPSQIAAYTAVIKFLQILGLSSKSVFGEDTTITSLWTSGKNIPGPNGTPRAYQLSDLGIGQTAAIMACEDWKEIRYAGNSSKVGAPMIDEILAELSRKLSELSGGFIPITQAEYDAMEEAGTLEEKFYFIKEEE